MAIELSEYRTLFEQSPGLLLILKPDLTIAAVTDAYLSATMTEREKITGKGIFEVFPDNPNDETADGVRNLRRSLNTVLQKKVQDIMPIQKYDIKKSGTEKEEFEERFWSPVNSPIMGSDGAVKYIVHKVEDVTEFVRLERKGMEQMSLTEDLRSQTISMGIEISKRGRELKETNIALNDANESLTKKTNELKRSNNELSLFASTAAHDIKAPFRSVGAFLEIIKTSLNGQLKDPNILSYFDRISKARARIASLLDDLLKYAKVTEQEVSFAKVDVSTVLADALKNLEYVIAETKGRVEVRCEMLSVLGDPVQIGQVFQNIIANGIKFHREGVAPEIIVSCEKKGQYAEFSIKDNGIGIGDKYFDKIFEVFQRLHNQDEYEGTGLGLSICKRIIEKHDGQIWIKSAEGEGSEFIFTLPIQE
jgi:signal transduction histidine kinase